MQYVEHYLEGAKKILDEVSREDIEAVVKEVAAVRDRGGRVFFIGVGGGAANASHAVNDYRKICGIEAYTPTDNVAELSARANDEGWETVFREWLRQSRLNEKDMVFVFSVGGGNVEKNVSVNIVNALSYAKEVGASICGVVGRDGGYTRKVATASVLIPTVDSGSVTPHTESFQMLVSHLIVSHPELCAHGMKWESIDEVK